MDPEQVRLIFKDTYNFYLKWKGAGYSDQMVSEVKELSRNYGDNDLVRHITVDLCTIIEQEGNGE